MNLSELRLPFVRTLPFFRGMTSASSPKAEHAGTPLLIDAADRTSSALLEQLQTRLAGLTEEEVHNRRAEHGRNTVVHERPTPWPTLLLSNLKNPFIAVLVLLGAVSRH